MHRQVIGRQLLAAVVDGERKELLKMSWIAAKLVTLQHMKLVIGANGWSLWMKTSFFLFNRKY